MKRRNILFYILFQFSLLNIEFLNAQNFEETYFKALEIYESEKPNSLQDAIFELDKITTDQDNYNDFQICKALFLNLKCNYYLDNDSIALNLGEYIYNLADTSEYFNGRERPISNISQKMFIQALVQFSYGIYFFNLKEYEEASQYFESGKRKMFGRDKKLEEYDIYNFKINNILSETYIFLGKYKEAINVGKEALKIAQSYLSKKEEFEAYKNLIDALRLSGKYPEAYALQAKLNSFYEKEELNEKLNDGKFNMSLIFQNAGDYHSADTLYQDVLKTAKLEKDTNTLFSAHRNLGSMYWDMMKLDSSLMQYDSALNFANHLSYRDEVDVILCSKFNLYLTRNEKEMAREALDSLNYHFSSYSNEDKEYIYESLLEYYQIFPSSNESVDSVNHYALLLKELTDKKILKLKHIRKHNLKNIEFHPNEIEKPISKAQKLLRVFLPLTILFATIYLCRKMLHNIFSFALLPLVNHFFIKRDDNPSKILDVQENEEVILNNGQKIRKGNISYIKSQKNKISIYLIEEQEPITEYSTLKATLKILRNPLFIQTHQSYLVNIKQIESWRNLKDSLEIKGRKEFVSISRGKKSEVYAHLEKFLN